MKSSPRNLSRRAKKHVPKLKRRKPGSKSWVIAPVKDVNPGDSIEWKAGGSDIVIWFPPKNDPLKIGQRTIRKGKSFVKKVPANLKEKGVFPYSVFCYETGEMASSNSSPYIRLI